MAYDQNDARIVTPAQYLRLRQWSQRKPAVALMGEFSAGKSTLLNFLIEEDLLPTRATATELPPVWFSHGKGGSYYVTADGNRVPLPDNDLDQVDQSARFVRLFVEAEILEHCDVIDTPGISDPNLAVETWRIAAGFANMVLWCTSATQAWRQTEYSAWTSLPERLRKHSLLIVTRADKLTTEVDKDKVARRMARETTELFAGTIFMATPNAVLAKAELANGLETPLWDESGAGPLLDNLVSRLEGVYNDKAALFERYALPEGASLEDYEGEVSTDDNVVPDEAGSDVSDAPPSEPVESEPPVASEPVASEEVKAEPEAEEVLDTSDQDASPVQTEVSEMASPDISETEVETKELQESEPVVEPVVSQDEAVEPLVLQGAVPEEEASAISEDVTEEAISSEEPSEAVSEEDVKAEEDQPALQQEEAPEVKSEEAAVSDKDESASEPTDGADILRDHGAYLKRSYEAREEKTRKSTVEVAAAQETQNDKTVSHTEVELPQQVLAWRNIVSQFPDNPSNKQVVDMIDKLLLEVFGGAADKTAPKSNSENSNTENEDVKSGEVSSAGWRRLA